MNMIHSENKSIIIRNIIYVLIGSLFLILIIYFAWARFSGNILGSGNVKVADMILETRSSKF